MNYKHSVAAPGSNKKHIDWSDSYSIGIPKIDDQHKELLHYVNDLFNHASDNEEEERAFFTDMIQSMVQYTKYHFSNEEKMMIATNFPGYTAHKKSHEEFVLKIIRIAKDFEAGKRLMLEKLAYFLKDWILSHIGVMDMQYAQYFRKIATRKADGRLSLSAADLQRQ